MRRNMNDTHSTFPFLLSLLLLLLPLYPSSPSTFPINVWPKPTRMIWPNPNSTRLSTSFTILSSHPSHPYLSGAIRRYTNLLRTERHRPLVPPSIPSSPSPLCSLSVAVSSPFSPLHHGVDESYSLSIPLSGPAVLSAATLWGAIRGLETFSQLTWSSPDSQLLVATGLNITDSPIFPHRGLLLDTARNFYPMKDILRTIRAMGYNKMNVLHWHITDSQSFPLLLPSLPNLALKGSYGPQMQYSPADVRRIVEYAMSYGVRVMPEIDVPGESQLYNSYQYVSFLAKDFNFEETRS